MAMHRTIMTQRREVTIPAAIWKALDLKEGDVSPVARDDNRVVLQRVEDIVDRTAGFFANNVLDAALSPSEERAWLEHAVADEVAASLAHEAADYSYNG